MSSDLNEISDLGLFGNFHKFMKSIISENMSKCKSSEKKRKLISS